MKPRAELDDVQLSDIEPLFVCKACGKRRALEGATKPFSEADEKALKQRQPNLTLLKQRGFESGDRNDCYRKDDFAWSSD
jgi:hypothetical protein